MGSQTIPVMDHPTVTESPEIDTSTSEDSEDDGGIPKWPCPPPKVVKPFLTSFTRFSDLPIEIRHVIWRLTLKPRTIDLDYSKQRGFWSQVKTPVALQVCSASRKAFINFSLDTLYFDSSMKNRLCQFLTGMTEYEFKHIQSIAFDRYIDEEWSAFNSTEDCCLDLFKKAASHMPALKEFLVVYETYDWHGHGFPGGTGALELFNEFQYEWKLSMYYEGFHINDGDAMLECQTLPNSDSLTEQLGAPKSRSVWGWRPIEPSIPEDDP